MKNKPLESVQKDAERKAHAKFLRERFPDMSEGLIEALIGASEVDPHVKIRDRNLKRRMRYARNKAKKTFEREFPGQAAASELLDLIDDDENLSSQWEKVDELIGKLGEKLTPHDESEIQIFLDDAVHHFLRDELEMLPRFIETFVIPKDGGRPLADPRTIDFRISMDLKHMQKDDDSWLVPYNPEQAKKIIAVLEQYPLFESTAKLYKSN